MKNNDLAELARKLVAPGKGILAADESTSTIKKRFDSIALECNENNRRDYRELLLTTLNIETALSGVIFYDETLRQSTREGKPFAKLLSDAGIIPGIKVDAGLKPLSGFPGEKITEGLDGLRERLEEYAKLGARFTKWRAVYTIDAELPSMACIQANAHALARYAAIAQDAGLVPIVEPEVLMDGTHTIERCAEVTERVLRATYRELVIQKVLLEGTLLKPNMVLPGQNSKVNVAVDEVAEWTLTVLRRAVPAAVPGIVFLSGGQGAEEATAHLNAMNTPKILSGAHPWQLSFSFGRALQAPCLDAWRGKPENWERAQKVFYQRTHLNHLARFGKYSPTLERVAAA